jgi:tRNA threonylcarbamoyladenosine biosynthesis protein TsaE
MRVFRTAGEEETVELGRRLAAELPESAVVLLTGGLGAGKTTLVKGIALGRGAASPEEVSSPTYTLIHEYGDPPTVYHIDLYRLEEDAELQTIELGDLFARRALVVIEWGEKFARAMPVPRFEIRIRRTGENEREITLAEIASPAARRPD